MSPDRPNTGLTGPRHSTRLILHRTKEHRSLRIIFLPRNLSLFSLLPLHGRGSGLGHWQAKEALPKRMRQLSDARVHLRAALSSRFAPVFLFPKGQRKLVSPYVKVAMTVRNTVGEKGEQFFLAIYFSFISKHFFMLSLSCCLPTVQQSLFLRPGLDVKMNSTAGVCVCVSVCACVCVCV